MRHVRRGNQRGPSHGQILPIAALALVAMIALSALILEGGNAYAQQRVTQNGSDAAANAGASVLARRLAGAALADSDVLAEVRAVAGANTLTAEPAYYTDVTGRPLDDGGAVFTGTINLADTSSGNALALVGDGAIPPNAQGVTVRGTRSFGTFIARAIGINSFDTSADATAVTGRLIGGNFLPVIFPVNIVDCETNGDLGTGEARWQISAPGSPPVGTEYLVPLCKTGTGQFMILDLDPNLRCDQEVLTPPAVAFDSFPVFVDGDQGNNCAKPIADAVNANANRVYLVPICDVNCVTTGGGNAKYKIIKVAAFYVDYMSDSNNKNNPLCAPRSGLVPIAGNGSSSCVAGWFVRYITVGPVGAGAIGNSDTIGIQLVK